MIIPPSMSFKGDYELATSLKSQAIKFYNYIARQADMGGVGYVARRIKVGNSFITMTSYKEGNYGNRFGHVSVLGISKPILILPDKYDIVVWPISATYPNGWPTNPRAGMLYVPGTPTDRLIITDRIGNEVDGGNCYWRDVDGKNVLSWEGPWGFQIAPQYSMARKGDNYISSTVGGYTPKYTFINNSPLPITRVDILDPSWDGIITTFTRFGTNIYQDGSILTTTPFPVMGCGISGDNLLAVVNISPTKDRIISKKLSNISGSWITIQDIDYPDSSALIYLERQGVYTFSQNGLKIITVVERFPNYLISYRDNAVKPSFSTVVRITLSSTFGTISHVSTTFTDDDVYSTTTSSTTTSSGSGIDGENYTSTDSNTASVTCSSAPQTISAGFVNNVEKLLTFDIRDYTSSTSNNSGVSMLVTGSGSNVYHDGYVTNTENSSYTIKLFLGIVELTFGGLTPFSFSSGSSRTSSGWYNTYFPSWPLHDPNDFTYDGSYGSTRGAVFNDLKIFFVDIEKGVVALQNAKSTQVRNETQSGSAVFNFGVYVPFDEYRSLLTETKISHKNKTLQIGSADRNVTITGGSAITFPFVWDPNPPGTVTSTSTYTSSLYINSLRSPVVDWDNNLDPFSIGRVNPSVFRFTDCLPMCKGVVDKRGNFVAEIICRYVDIMVPFAGSGVPYVTYTQGYYKDASLPYSGNASTIFTGRGPITSISGETLPTSDRTRKVFLIN